MHGAHGFPKRSVSELCLGGMGSERGDHAVTKAKDKDLNSRQKSKQTVKYVVTAFVYVDLCIGSSFVSSKKNVTTVVYV